MEPLRSRNPHQIGDYRLLGRLGAGGMGEVFLGESPGGRKVAVKLVRNDHADDLLFRQRFAREVEAAKMVGGFHTAPVVDADPDGNPPWLATAYIPGPSLADLIQQRGPLPPETVGRLGAALSEGLAAIHACGLVHRDLKPANVILADDGPRIIDFGLARVSDSTSLTSSGVVVGTISYMSPEQVSGERVDARSDVFSLGCVLGYAATGQSPFTADTMPAIAARIVNGTPDLGGIDDPPRSVIEACLAKDPAGRPALNAVIAHLSGTALQDSYSPYSPPPSGPATAAGHPPTVPAVSGRATSVQSPTSPAPPRRQPRRGKPVAAISVSAAVILAAIGGAAYLLTSGGTGTPAAASSPAASSRAAIPRQTFPAGYTGTWQGTLTNPSNRRQAVPTLKIGTPGPDQIVGYASSPRAGCKYVLRWVASSRRTGSVSLSENLSAQDAGNSACHTSYVVLTRSGSTSLNISQYRNLPPAPGEAPVFTGKLQKQP